MNSAKRGSKKERSNTQVHDTWMVWRALTLWVYVVWDVIIHARKHEKMWRVRVFCSQALHRLQQIAISCKRSCFTKLKNMTATMRHWKKKMTNATFWCWLKKDWSRSFFSRWLVVTVHNCDCCSEVSVHFCLICSSEICQFFRYLSNSSDDGQ